MAWYQRTYFNLNIGKLIKLIIILFVLYYYFYFCSINLTQCKPLSKTNSFLQHHFILNNNVYCYKNIDFNAAFDLIHKIKCLNNSNLSYDLCRYLDLNGNRFPRNSSLDHFNLKIFEFSAINPDISVHLQLSHKNFNNCSLLSPTDIFNEDRIQYISRNFYLYENSEILKDQEHIEEIRNYLNNNEIKKEINKNIKYVLNLHHS